MASMVNPQECSYREPLNLIKDFRETVGEFFAADQKSDLTKVA